MVAVFLFFAIFGGSGFLSAAGTASWLSIASEIGIIALPIGLLMIAGELDISVGAVIPAASLTAAIISGYYGLPDWLGITAALGLGLAIGLINGVFVTRTTIPSLIITIGTMFGTMGLTLGLDGDDRRQHRCLRSVPDPNSRRRFSANIIGGMFQVTILWWLVYIVALLWLLHISPVGNWIYALGGDKESARNAGIPTKRLTIGLFMLSGFSAAFVGVSQVMVYQSAQVLAGQSFIFNSIMCVVIGGVLLTGGFGSVIGIVFGTITFSIVNQGIYFTGIDPNMGSVIIGALLLIAVLTNDTFRRLALSYSSKKA